MMVSKAFATGLLLAATVSIASAAEGSFSGGDAESCEEEFGKDFCHELGPLAALYASAVVVFVILGILCLLVPCIVFGVAWCTCVSNKQKLGRSPTGGAWASCCGIFLIGAILLNLVVPGVYIIFSFVMIIPFCMDSCYTQPVGGIGANLIIQTQYAQAPQQYAQVAPQYAQAPQQQYAQQPQPGVQQAYATQPVQADAKGF